MYHIALDSRRRIWGDCWNWLTVYDSNANITDFHSEKPFIDYYTYNSNKEKMVNIYTKYPSLKNLWPAYHHSGRTLDILADNETIYTINRDSCFFINVNNLTYKSIRYSLYDKQSPTGIEPIGVKLQIDKKNDLLYANVYNYDSAGSAIIQYDLKKKEFKRILIPSSIKVPVYYAQFPWYDLDDFGNIWVGTSQGVIVYEPHTFKRIYSFEKMNKGVVKQLINITNKGVMCIMSEIGIELYDYINDRTINLSVTDGLYTNAFQIGGYANSMLFISYPGYLQYMPIDSFLNKRENRKCYLSEFFISDKENRLFPEPEFLENVKLKYYQHDITLTVSTTEFNHPNRLQYRYMLEGADKEWSYSDFENRSITYRNLLPGTYLYKAAIKNSDGSWSDNELKLAIIIQPAFWQTSWFKFLCVVIILGLVYLFNHRRIKKIRSQEKQRLIHEKELIELEAKALRAQMNPHFIFNCLNSIKSLIQDDQKDKSVTYLTTFSKLIRTLFNNADKKEIPLYDEIETCKLYLQLEAMRFDAKFSYAVNVDEQVDLKSILVPALIIQPFIENAIWHGIVPKGGGGNVSLSVLKNNSCVEIVIDDDGIGREASQQNKAASNIGHQSKGVNLTQSRLELDNLLQQRQASLETIDKKDADGKTAGTKVIIKLMQED